MTWLVALPWQHDAKWFLRFSLSCSLPFAARMFLFISFAHWLKLARYSARELESSLRKSFRCIALRYVTVISKTSAFSIFEYREASLFRRSNTKVFISFKLSLILARRIFSMRGFFAFLRSERILLTYIELPMHSMAMLFSCSKFWVLVRFV